MLLFVAGTFLSECFATDGLFTNIHHHYQSPRALGMGDAFVAVSNDYSALLYNPAALARLDSGQINLSMDVAFSNSFSTFMKELQSASSGTNESAKNTQIMDLFQKNYGRQYSIRSGLFEGVMAFPGWSLAVIPMDMSLDFALGNQVAPAANARLYLDTTVAFGIGKEVKSYDLGGRFAWGTTLKFINRGFFTKQILSLDLAADSNLVKNEDIRDGYTLDMDVGVLYTPYLPTEGIFSTLRLARPTFGAVIRNVADYGFGSTMKVYNKGTFDAPEKLYRVLDLGSRWEYPGFFIFGGRGVLDVRDIGHPYWSMRKGLHIGFEIDWSMTSWWKGQYRLGWNQGYYTAGASALFTLFRLDLVTYAEDIGSFDSPKENRMYMAKFNIDW